MKQTLVEKKRTTAVTAQCGVLVAGGGIAGIAAALAAARHGADVLLVERECLLGGLATLGLVTIYLPLCDGMGNQVSFGIAEELLRLAIRHGAEAKNPAAWLKNGSLEERKKQRFEVQYNPHLFALEAERLLLGAGVNILYNTVVCATAVRRKKITHVIVENKGGRSAIETGAVVDATGDADICHLSGEQTVCFGRGNTLASWYYHFADGQIHLNLLGGAEEIAGKKTDADGARRFSGLDGFENSEMLCLSHGQTLRHILKRRETSPGYVPSVLPSIPQLRMTRRLAGARTMDESERGKSHPDGIGAVGNWRQPGPVYEIPFSTLHGNTIQNLAAAGRCISVTDPLWDITRAIPACAVTGQAAGTAAAMTNHFAKLDVQILRAALMRDGARFLQQGVTRHE